MGLLGVIVISSLGLPAAGAAASSPRQVTVSGICKRSVTSDRASIIVAAEFRDRELRSAAKKATEAYEKVRDAVKKLALENLELRTSEYSVQNIREWEKDKLVSKGFQARMGLYVATSEVGRLGEVIAIAAREGMQDVGTLSSFLSPARLLHEQTECLEEAAKNARVKAERLAGALGAKVGKVDVINESWSVDAPQPRPMAKSMMMDESARSMAPPSLEGGKEDLSVTVQATFALD